jgi:hypothetical protein
MQVQRSQKAAGTAAFILIVRISGAPLSLAAQDHSKTYTLPPS